MATAFTSFIYTFLFTNTVAGYRQHDILGITLNFLIALSFPLAESGPVCYEARGEMLCSRCGGPR
jgi:hypothetical protein